MRKLIFILLLSTSASAQTYHALEASYISLQVADVALTYKALSLGAYEANPVMRWAIDKHLFIPGKIVMTTAFLYVCRRMRVDNPRMALIYLVVGNLAYTAIVANNYSVTIRLKI